MDNIRAVLARAISRGDGAVALQLSGALKNFWFYGGHYYEARYWLESALALQDGASAGIRARAYLVLGHVVRQHGDNDLADQCALQALPLYEEAGDRAGHVEALILIGWVNIYRGNFVVARHWAEQALNGARTVGDTHITASALDTLCTVIAGHGNFEQAESLCSESLALYREVGDLRNVGRLLSFISVIALWQGEIDRAEEFIVESLAQFDRLGDIDGSSFALLLYGRVDLERADYWRAYAKFAQALSIDEKTGAMKTILSGLDGMAFAAAGLNDQLHGARLLGAAAAQRERLGVSLEPWWKDRYDRDRAAIRDHLGLELFEAAEQQGRAWTLKQAVENAINWCEPATDT